MAVEFGIDEVFLKRNKFMKSDCQYTDIPLVQNQKILYFYVLRKSSVSDVEKLSVDCYSPWSRKGGYLNYRPSYTIITVSKHTLLQLLPGYHECDRKSESAS